jgi:hypothetical protein
MRRVMLSLLLIAMLLFGVAQAQDSYKSPLLALLATVPDTTNNRTQLIFNDRAAIEAAYPPARLPADFAEFSATTPDLEDLPDTLLPVRLWGDIYLGTASSMMGVFMMLSEEMPAVVGFDYFDVEQELNYGTPPAQSLMVSGAFDLDTVRAALTVQGYAQVDAPADELWCPESACDLGTQVNLQARNQANPFGGDLGRRFPVFMGETSIVGSPSEDVIDEHIAVATGEQPSLADAPDYAAAVEALTRDGVLMQAMFFAPSALPLNPTPGAGLPPYVLFALADVATNESQEARLVLIYADEDTAAEVAERLPARLADTLSFAVNASWGELMETRNVTNIISEVVMTEAGLPAVMMTFQGERGTQEQILENSLSNQDEIDFSYPGNIFRLLTTAAFRQDLVWLSIGSES